jgi:hypothetical protein
MSPSKALNQSPNTRSPEFDFDVITEDEVFKQLSDIIPIKVTGIDMLAPKILKIHRHNLTPALTVLFNNCIAQGKFLTPFQKSRYPHLSTKKDQRLTARVIGLFQSCHPWDLYRRG